MRGSLTGSVVGNILLVLGFSLLVRPRRPPRPQSSFVWLGLILFATLGFCLSGDPGWHGDPERHSLAVSRCPVAIFLLVLYIGVTWWQLRGTAQHVASDGAKESGRCRARSACWPPRPWSPR